MRKKTLNQIIKEAKAKAIKAGAKRDRRSGQAWPLTFQQLGKLVAQHKAAK
jgi:hypothetical protein